MGLGRGAKGRRPNVGGIENEVIMHVFFLSAKQIIRPPVVLARCVEGIRRTTKRSIVLPCAIFRIAQNRIVDKYPRPLSTSSPSEGTRKRCVVTSRSRREMRLVPFPRAQQNESFWEFRYLGWDTNRRIKSSKHRSAFSTCTRRLLKSFSDPITHEALYAC